MEEGIEKVIEEICSNPNHLSFQNTEDTSIIINISLTSTTFAPQKQYFGNKTIVFDEKFPKIDYETIQFKDSFEKCGALLKTNELDFQIPQFLECIAEKIKENKNDHFFDICATFLYFYQTLNFDVLISGFVSLFDDLMSPNYCVMKQKDELNKIQLFSLRGRSVDILLHINSGFLFQKVKDSLCHPEIFQEICYIIAELCHLHNYNIKKKKFGIFLHDLTRILFVSNSNENSNIFIEQKAFLYLLNELSNDEELSTVFVESIPFLDLLLSLLPENSIRPLIFKFLEGKLTHKNVVLDLPQYIERGIEYRDELDIDLFKLLSDCLEAIIKENDISGYFNLWKSTKIAMQKWQFYEESQQLIINCLEFYVRIQPPPEAIEVLTVPLQTLKERNLVKKGDKITNLLIDLLFGKKYEEFSTSRIIANPVALNVLFSLYVDEEILDVSLKLCEYSTKNIIKLHESKFDVLILEKLNEIKDDDCQTEEIKMILKNVRAISTVISSPKIVQEFINILTPTNGLKYKSKSHPLVLTALAEIFHKISIEPNSFSKLSQTFGAEFDFQRGIVVTFWGNIVTKSPSVLLIISDKESGEKGVELSVTTESIIINNKEISKFISPLKWSFFAVSVDFKGSVSVSINGVVVEKEFKFNCRHKLNTIRFGGTEDTSNSIGNIAISSLNKEDDINNPYKQLYTKGPKYAKENTFLSIFARKERKQNFSDVFFDVYGVSILIPLFAHIDLTTSDGGSLDILTDLVKTLTAALIVNEDAQKSFANENGFIIIRHLLFYAKTSNINFQLYSQFYDLFKQLTCTELKKQLFKYLLLDFRLFSNASISDQKLIVDHIAAILFVAHNNLFMELTSFANILYNLQIFYLYKKRSAEYESFNTAIKGIRKTLLELCYSFAKKKFTQDDFDYAMNCFATINDESKYELSELILKIAPFVKKEDSQRVFDRMLRIHFFHNFDDRTIVNCIKIIIILYKVCDFSVSLHDQLMLLSRGIFTMKRGQMFLEGLSEIINNGEPEVFPIFTMALMKLHDIKQIFLVKPSESLVTTRSWCLNVVLAVIHEQKEEESNKAFKFLALCSSKEWSHIFDLIECVCIIEERDSNPYKTQFLIEVSKLVMEKEYTEQEVSTILFLLEELIYVKRVPYTNKALNSIYENSPFFDKSHKSEKKTKLYQKTEKMMWRIFGGDFSEYDNFIESELIDTKKITFAINITPESEWVHLKIAEIYVKILLKYRIEDFFACGNLTNCFLIEKDFDFAAFQISQMNLNNDITRFVMAKTKPKKTSNEMSADFFNLAQKFIESALSSISKRHQTLTYAELHNAIREDSLASLNACKFIFDYAFDCDKLYIQKCNEFSTEEQILFENGESEWERLWCNASTLGSPWYFKSENKTNWKRSRIICGNFCPMKMKKNKRFNSYKKESYARDIGSLRAAEIKAMKDIQKETEERLKSSPPKIFEVNQKTIETLPKKSQNADQVIITKSCTLRKVTGNDKCIFKLYKKYLTITSSSGKQRVIRLVDLVFVLLRKVIQKITGIEIFTVLGRNYFLDFGSNPMPIIDALIQLNVGKRSIVQSTTDFEEFFSKWGYTEKWMNGEMTNFEYLMHLNIFSGRSFNDPSIYPLFPWTITDFTSKEPELCIENFRNLSKPIGAIGEERFEELKERLNDLKIYSSSIYLYSSYVISPLSVYLWLLRLEPFTGQHVQLQGGKFDQASRIFSSIQDSYKMCTTTVNDYRELVPEFYFMSEFLINSNHFDLGKVRGNKIDDVELPEWANNSAEEFIYKMRYFLESDIVTEHLNEWIDIIWGYKTTGIEAEKADNTYMPEIYEDIWKKDKNIDAVREMEITAMMSNVGQVPTKLFSKPHPKKTPQNITKTYPQTSFSLDNEATCGFVSAESNGCLRVIIGSKKSIEVYKVAFESKGINISYEKDLASFSSDEYATCVYPMNNIFYLTNKKNIYCGKDVLISGAAEFIDFDGAYFISAVATKVKIMGPHLCHTIPFYDEKIACLALSKSFKTFVVCTESGKLFLGDLFKGKKINAVALEHNGNRAKPILSLITKSFGYIVTYASYVNKNQETKRCIFVHNINGHKIKSVDVFYEISKWSKFTTEKGVDFVLFVDKNGSLYTFNAFKVNIVKFTITPGVCCLSYCCKRNTCIVISNSNKESKISFIPLSIH